jgi:hypothetical protein
MNIIGPACLIRDVELNRFPERITNTIDMRDAHSRVNPDGDPLCAIALESPQIHWQHVAAQFNCGVSTMPAHPSGLFMTCVYGHGGYTA